MKALMSASVAALVLVACGKSESGTSESSDPAEISSPGNTGGAAEAPQGPATYYFGAADALTTITFSSETSVTNIMGSTRKVSGSATIDFEKGTGACELSVPVASLNTGMADRDRAMLGELWLNAEKHGTISFKVESAKLVEKPRTWELAGKFTLRGVTKDLTVKADVVRVPAEVGDSLGKGRWVKAKTQFPIDITAHGIEIPEKSTFTVEKVWKVDIQLFGTTEKPEGTPEPVVKENGEPDRPPRPIRAKRLKPDGLTGDIYRFGLRSQLTTITATSETSAERVTAQTSTMSGYAGIDFDKGEAQVRLSVPVKSLKTGIEKRDGKLAGPNWLDAEKHPHIDFESTKVTKKDDATWIAEGNLTIHGQTKPVSTEVQVAEVPKEILAGTGYASSKGLQFKTELKVKLSDFGVTIPEISVGKVNDEWTLKLFMIAAEVPKK